MKPGKKFDAVTGTFVFYRVSHHLLLSLSTQQPFCMPTHYNTRMRYYICIHTNTSHLPHYAQQKCWVGFGSCKGVPNSSHDTINSPGTRNCAPPTTCAWGSPGLWLSTLTWCCGCPPRNCDTSILNGKVPVENN